MMKLIREKRFEEVILACKKSLKTNPQDYNSRYVLGVAYLASGAFTKSIRCFEKIIKKSPDDYQCFGNLGVAYLRLKKYDKSIFNLNKSITLEPKYTDAKYNLGCLHLDQNQPEKARQVFKNLVKQCPDDTNYQCALSDSYRALGHWKSAIEGYLNSLEIDSDFVRAHINLGALYLFFGEYEKALKHCRKAVELQPTEFKTHKNLADCYIKLENLDDAMNSYADAFELNHSSAILCVSIGKVWQETGDIEEATSWFDKAIALDENFTEAKCYLAKIISDHVSSEAAIEILEPLLVQENNHIELNITLSDIYIEDGNVDFAMQRLEHIKSLQPDFLSIQIKIAGILNSSGDTDGAIKLYNETLAHNPRFIPGLNGLATSQKGKLNQEQVVVMERLLLDDTKIKEGRGSSLHSGLAYYYDSLSSQMSTNKQDLKAKTEKAAFHMRESNKLQWHYRNKRDWDYKQSEYKNHINALIKIFDKNYFKKFSNIGNPSVTPIFIVGMPRSGTTLTEQILARHSKILGAGERPFASQSFHAFNQGFKPEAPNDYLDKITAENISEMSAKYLIKLQCLIDKSAKQGVSHVVDKMPDNYSLIGWILTLFPNAKIIHAGRDTRDVALSCWLTQFASIPWASRADDLVHRIKQYQKIMSHWQCVVGPRIFESKYEELVSNQEQCSKELIEFLGLKWEEQCLKFYDSDRLVRTASITQVRQPIYKKSVKKWQRYSQCIPELFDSLIP